MAAGNTPAGELEMAHLESREFFDDGDGDDAYSAAEEAGAVSFDPDGFYEGSLVAYIPIEDVPNEHA